MKNRFDRRGLMLLGVSFAVIALDQYTKGLVRQYLPLNQSWNPIPWLDPIVTLTYVRNTGAAFGLFPNMGPFFVFVAMVVIALIIIYYRKISSASWVLRLALGLQLGGATGNNMIDRLWYGYVTDFVDVRIWPVFNVADSAVVVGTFLLAYYALFMDRPPKGEDLSVERPAIADQPSPPEDAREAHNR